VHSTRVHAHASLTDLLEKDPREFISLSDHVVFAKSVNTFKNQSDRFWSNQDVFYDYTADLHGIGNRTVVM